MWQSNLRWAMDTKRIYLIGGAGGVGKTTLSASIGASLASQGNKTLVVTVDPAKRLSQTLGLKGTSQVESIPLPPPYQGTLYASLLDATQMFERVMGKFSRTPDQKEKILSHPLYKILVSSLGGSHEYAAMEQLFELTQESDFTHIVIDTPPSQNAMELFEAPGKLIAFIDNPLVQWFGKKNHYIPLLRKTTKHALSFLSHLFGAKFLESFTELMQSFEGMQGGFRERQKKTLQILQSPSTYFYLITHASESRYEESIHFLDYLKSHGIPLHRLVFNKMIPKPPTSWEKDAGASLPKETLSFIAYSQQLYAKQQYWAQKFQTLIPQSQKSVYILEKRDPPQTLTELIELGNHVLNL